MTEKEKLATYIGTAKRADMSNDTKAFSWLVRKGLKLSGLFKHEAAKALGTNSEAISDWAAHRTAPPGDIRQTVVKFFLGACSKSRGRCNSASSP